MVRKDYFVFGDINTLLYDAIIIAKNVDVSPARKSNTVSIPGRNGLLIEDEDCYDNTEISYKLAFKDKSNANIFADRVFNVIGYQRLEDSEYPDEFWECAIISPDAVSRYSYDNSRFIIELKFTRKPQRYFKLGEYPQKIELINNVAYTFRNPIMREAKPLIRIRQNISTAQHTVDFYDAKNTVHHIYLEGRLDITIDCELQEIYDTNTKTSTNKVSNNAYYPTLLADGMKLKNGGDASQASDLEIWITPRYWRV